MPKEPKANSSRKPPEPTEDHAVIEEWITRGVMPGINPIVKTLDEQIRKAIPKLHYAMKWKKAYYGVPKQGWVIELAAYDVSANIVFHGGVDLDPPPPLGTSGRSRYVKLTSVEEAEAPEIKKWIKQAGKVPGWQ